MSSLQERNRLRLVTLACSAGVRKQRRGNVPMLHKFTRHARLSTIIRETSRSARRLLRVISSGLPMGIEIRYSVPGDTGEEVEGWKGLSEMGSSAAGCEGAADER